MTSVNSLEKHLSCVVRLILSLVLAGVTMVGCAKEQEGPADTNKSFLRLVTEVTKLFQQGTKRLSSDRLKELIVEVGEEHSRFYLASRKRSPDSEDLKERMFEAVENLVRYLDSHRLAPSDVVEIREWLAASFDASAENANPSEGIALGYRASDAILASAKQLEPRHIMLFTVVGQPLATLPLAGQWFVEIAPGSSEEERAPDWLRTKAFLMAPENEVLWNVFRDVCTSFSSARDAHLKGITQRCVESTVTLALAGDDPAEFKEALDVFMGLSKEALIGDRLPDFALAERFIDVCLLRDAWNLVHLYGTEDAKEHYQAHLVSLRDFYSARADRVSVQWLNQVMEAPEEPVWLNRFLSKRRQEGQRE